MFRHCTNWQHQITGIQLFRTVRGENRKYDFLRSLRKAYLDSYTRLAIPDVPKIWVRQDSEISGTCIKVIEVIEGLPHGDLAFDLEGSYLKNENWSSNDLGNNLHGQIQGNQVVASNDLNNFFWKRHFWDTQYNMQYTVVCFVPCIIYLSNGVYRY